MSAIFYVYVRRNRCMEELEVKHRKEVCIVHQNRELVSQITGLKKAIKSANKAKVSKTNVGRAKFKRK